MGDSLSFSSRAVSTVVLVIYFSEAQNKSV